MSGAVSMMRCSLSVPRKEFIRLGCDSVAEDLSSMQEAFSLVPIMRGGRNENTWI